MIRGAEEIVLARIAPVVDTYVPPATPIDPAGAWTHAYQMITLCFDLFRPEGELELSRAPRAGGGSTLLLTCRRNGRSGYAYWTRAELHCRDDALSTPISWWFETKLAKQADDDPCLYSGVRREFALKEGEGIGGAGGTLIPPGEAYTAKYCLFDAVQRLPGDGARPLDFTLLDEFDLPRRDHRLAYRGTVTVETANGPIALTVYQQTGRGVIPTTFWVDGRGRLLFWLMGVQALILSRAADEAAAYELPRRGGG